MSKYRQNNISTLRKAGIDLGPRWREVLKHVVESSSFSPDIESARKIQWWNTGKVGSVSCLGKYLVGGKEVQAVLKIQGSKPRTSEVKMIKEFHSQNKSKIIRAPVVYKEFLWDEDTKFEAFILEKLVANYSIVSHPATDFELNRFFELYEEYRVNCRSIPWLAKQTGYSYQKNINDWLGAVKDDREKDKYFDPNDSKLMAKAVYLVEKNLSAKDLEFAHGHLAADDFRIVSKTEVVLKSNLFWSWRVPFYDAVFGYHWWMLGMEHATGLTSEILDKERDRWLTKIYNLSEVRGNARNERLVVLALLERAVPALMVDRFMMDQTKPSAEIVAKSARKELKRLIKGL